MGATLADRGAAAILPTCCAASSTRWSTPDRARRRQLQRVRVLVVPPVDEVAAAPLLAALRASPGVDHDDASIAAAAVAHGVPLVTEDRALRVAAAVHLPRLPVWDWTTDLRPRLLLG
jgi:predicted nucleic acid-binding protein